MEFKQIRQEINEKFIYVGPLLDAFEAALAMKQNVLLTGPRGHGKSELSKLILSLALGEPPFILPMGPGTRAEQIFGAFDMNEWTSNSKIRYMIEEGFMGSKSAILEEFLDCNPQVLEMLKDPIMRGELCNGKLCVKSECKIVVGCTNYDPDAWATRDGFTTESYYAMLDRFAFRVKVEWPSYEDASYREMMMKQGCKGPWVKELAQVCAELTKQGHMVTPRNCMIASKGYEQFGMKVFQNFMGLPEGIYTGMLKEAENLKKTAAITAVLDEIEEFCAAASIRCTLGQPSTQQEVANIVKNIKAKQTLMSNMNVNDQTAHLYRQMKLRLENLQQQAGETLVSLVK